MRLDEIIQQHTQKLSPQLQAEVFDFVLFLEQKQAKQSLVNTAKQVAEPLDDSIPPLTQSLIGILQNCQVSDDDYKKHLESKYL